MATAERRREELESKLCGGAAHSRETERQRNLWERRAEMLRKMRNGLEQMSECQSPVATWILKQQCVVFLGSYKGMKNKN